ncbi:hypothetical protein [Parahaliea mediterranea]|uniref:Uncharacterized protein n=1 Tax=Parahaliea mediterranea TaxID=651086 RepID=A0A939ILT3_9GAMM|nr:hypothetical protein [Parahaliea mediterranea]MBN7796292.1 hypothetical protein [Parahaliea mediterranea]
MNENIDYVAWWGAILSSIVFAWNVLKWKLSGPKLDVRISPYEYQWKGKFELMPGEERKPAGVPQKMKPFVVVEVRNTGRSATTILEIRFSQCDSPKGFKKSMMSENEHDPFSNELPVVLEAGHVWLCRFDQNQVTKFSEENNTPHFSVDIRHTHAKGWVREPVEIESKS